METNYQKRLVEFLGNFSKEQMETLTPEKITTLIQTKSDVILSTLLRFAKLQSDHIFQIVDVNSHHIRILSQRDDIEITEEHLHFFFEQRNHSTYAAIVKHKNFSPTDKQQQEMRDCPLFITFIEDFHLAKPRWDSHSEKKELSKLKPEGEVKRKRVL